MEDQDRKDAEAAFASDDTPVPAVVVEAKPEPVVEQKEAPIVDEWEGVPPVVRRTLEGITGKLGALDQGVQSVKTWDGRISAIQGQLDAAKAAAKEVKGPTPAEIEAASKTMEGWEDLKEFNPGWAAALDARFAAERAELLKQTTPVDVDGIKRDLTGSISQAEIRAERRAREFARIDRKYEDWEADVKAPAGGFTPEFAAWYDKQPAAMQALANSENSRDALKMLDAFYESKKAVANKTRLEAAIPAKGVDGQREPTQSEREAAEKAFASA